VCVCVLGDNLLKKLLMRTSSRTTLHILAPRLQGAEVVDGPVSHASVNLRVLFVIDRCVPGALPHPADPHRHPAVLPGARRGAADPQGQHRGVELHQPSAGGHRLRQLHGEGGGGGARGPMDDSNTLY